MLWLWSCLVIFFLLVLLRAIFGLFFQREIALTNRRVVAVAGLVLTNEKAGRRLAWMTQKAHCGFFDCLDCELIVGFFLRIILMQPGGKAR